MKDEEKRHKKNRRGFFADPVFVSLFLFGIVLLAVTLTCFTLFQLIGYDNRDLGQVFTGIYVGTSVGAFFVFFGAFLYMFIRKGLGYEAKLKNGYYPKAKGSCTSCYRPLPLGAAFCPRCGKKSKEDLSHDRKAEVVDELIQKKRDLPGYFFYFHRGLMLNRPYYLLFLGLALFFAALMFIDFHTADGIDAEIILIAVLLLVFLAMLFVGPIFVKSFHESNFKEASYKIRQNGIEIHEVYARGKKFVTLEEFVAYEDCFASKETEEGYLLFTHIGGRRYAICLPMKNIAFSTISFVKAKSFAISRRKD